MADEAQHIIQKQVFDIHHGNYVNAHARQTEISTRYENEVVPLLEKACDELCPDDRIIKIDTLVVALPPMTEQHYKEKWAAQVEKAFREQLLNAIKQTGQSLQNNTNTSILSRAEADLQLLTAFLYTGAMPWCYKEDETRSLEMIFRELIVTEKTAIRQLITEGLKQPSFAKRLYYQFPDSLINELFYLLQPSRATAIRNSYQWLRNGLKQMKDPGDRSDIDFLLRYHSLQLLVKPSYQDEEQLVRQLLESVSHKWKIPFPELLDKLISAVKPGSVHPPMRPFLQLLEAMPKASGAISAPEETVRKTPLMQQEKQKAKDHNLRKQLLQLLREMEKIESGQDQENETAIENLKQQLERCIDRIESRKVPKDNRYTTLFDILKQLLQELEQNDDIFVNAFGQFKNALETWFNDFETQETSLNIEDSVESGGITTQKNDALHPEVAMVNPVFRELLQLLLEMKEIESTQDQESKIAIGNLQKLLKRCIDHIESRKAPEDHRYKTLSDILKQWLKELEQDDGDFVNTSESFKKLLERCIDRIESRKAPEDHHYKTLSEILKQWLQELEQDDGDFVNASEGFKNSLEAWFNDFKVEGSSLNIEDPPRSGDIASQKSDAVPPETVMVNRICRELQQLLWEAAPADSTDRQQRNAFYTTLKQCLQHYLEQCQDLPLKAKKSYKVLMENLKQLLKDVKSADETSEAEYEHIKLSLTGLLNNFPKHTEHRFQEESQQLAREETRTAGSTGQEPETEASGPAYERLKKLVKTLIEDVAAEEENSWEALQQSPEGSEAEEIYLQNAGLVIVWPFFKPLFEELKFTEKYDFKGEASQYRAVHLLQYLAAGEESCEEYRLGLNKLLCGLALNDPVPREIVLSEKEKESTEELIKAAIGHWPMMENTSVEGLREAFLLRDGKLSRNTDGWLLQVEQKSYDMIMNKLPWSIGLVKLPWMPEPLFVEW